MQDALPPNPVIEYHFTCERCGYEYSRPRPDLPPILCPRCLRYLGKIMYRAMQAGNNIQPPLSRTIRSDL